MSRYVERRAVAMVAALGRTRTQWVVLAIFAVVFLTVSLTGCGAKATEPFKDSSVSGRNSNPATVGEMPDGFSNFAYKCVGTDMVFTLFHSNSNYGGITVVPNDPACGGKTP